MESEFLVHCEFSNVMKLEIRISDTPMSLVKFQITEPTIPGFSPVSFALILISPPHSVTIIRKRIGQAWPLSDTNVTEISPSR